MDVIFGEKPIDLDTNLLTSLDIPKLSQVTPDDLDVCSSTTSAPK